VIVLGIESSCDELAAAVLDRDGKTLRSSVVRSQVEMHARYGGVVPELASRDHIRAVGRVVAQALEDAKTPLAELEGIAVTAGPGLVGSLLCGLEFAKGLALATKKPFVGVNHLEGHIAASFLEDPAPEPPFVALLISGGHTALIHVRALGGPYEHLGQTRDDAAGEAFDKTAKMLGLGYPGGIAIDRLSQGRDRERFDFPVMMAGRDNLEFSFSGLKTAASRLIRESPVPIEGELLGDFCASFQDAVVDNLLKKAFRAVALTGSRRLVFAGGVAANSRIRERAAERGRRENVAIHLPSRANCTDNAAMIARAGQERLRRGERHGLDLAPRSHWPLVDAPGRKKGPKAGAAEPTT
jgi:N6-L-threonylcarbamoyladenine synthase